MTIPIDDPDAKAARIGAHAIAHRMRAQLDILGFTETPYPHQRREDETLVSSVEFIRRCCQIAKVRHLSIDCRAEHITLLTDFSYPSLKHEPGIPLPFLPLQDVKVLLDEGVFDFTVGMMKEAAVIGLNHHSQISNSEATLQERITLLWGILFIHARRYNFTEVMKEAISSGLITQLAGWHFDPSYKFSDRQCCRL